MSIDTDLAGFRSFSAMFSRRKALGAVCSALAGGLCVSRLSLAAARFWDSKPAAQWTAAEIEQLLSSSPWAKQVTAQYRAAMGDRRPDAEPVQGRGETRVGECGLVPCGEVTPGTAMVTWESALPIREALHSTMPPEYNGHYVISIRGLAGEYTTDGLKTGSELSAKGRVPLQPGMVGRRNSTLLFAFSREMLPLSAADKDVQFTVHTGASLSATLLRATFSPKDMTYRGLMAL